jgi:imidazolonepropionase-like amidohydrolase
MHHRRHLLHPVSAFVLALVSLPGQQVAVAQPGRDAPPLAIVGVDLAPMGRQGLVRGQTVLVRDGRIEYVGPVSEVSVPDGATRIDGAGRVLVPGVAESRAHHVRLCRRRAG